MSWAHTPGPWVVNDDEIETEAGEYICHYGHRIEADAYLIAAAPELLEALQRIMNSGHALSQPLRWEAEAAIAKAKGAAA